MAEDGLLPRPESFPVRVEAAVEGAPAGTSPIEFRLFAPNNRRAALIGSFNDWKETPMKKGKDGYFRVIVYLPDGEHRYRFRVQSKSWFFRANEWVTVTDPYAIDVDRENDNAVLRIHEGRPIIDLYEWQHDDKPLPPNHELVTYELHVGDFSGGEADPFTRGKYTDVVHKLDYLIDLGINAIELMPVKEYAGDHSWGYNPRYFFATETGYGTTEELKRLIDECHARGIRVIIDGVYNHSEASAPLTQIDHDYWYYHDPKDAEHNWGPEFNYEAYDERFDLRPAWKFIGDTVCYWVREFHLDGIRYDAARQIGNFEFMGWIAEQARRMVPMKPFLNAAEYMPPDPAVTGLDGPMDACWNEFFKNILDRYLCGGECELEEIKNAIDTRRLGFASGANLVNYLANHDQQRLMKRLGDHGILGEEAFRRHRLGAAILMTSIGMPLIWMGEEFGEYKPKTPDSNKIDWQLLQYEENRALFDFYKGLIALRRLFPALRGDNLEFIFESPDERLLAYWRWSDSGDQVVVALNLSDEAKPAYTISGIPVDGVWQIWPSGEAIEIAEGRSTLDLPPREARIIIRKPES